MKHEVYLVDGMTCASCSSAVERVTRKLPGVSESQVNLVLGTLDISYDDQLVASEDIIQKIEKAGYSAKLKAAEKQTETTIDEDPEKLLKNEGIQVGIALALSAVLLYVAMGPMLFKGIPIPDLFSMDTHAVNAAMLQMLLTIPILLIGRRFFTHGFKALFHGSPTMDSLVALGASASFLFSLAITFLISDNPHHVHQLYYESAGIVVSLVMLGKHLEARSKLKTTEAIRKLMELAPDKAFLVKPDGDVVEVATSSVKVGDSLLIKPGSKVPLDGMVIKGNSAVDESLLTGESMPVEKNIDSELIGGSLNQQGALYMKVTRVGEDTTLNRIVRFVQDAQGKKAPISGLADKVAAVFVPIVIGIAVISSLAWLIAGKDLSFIVSILTAVLVIACPCAMGLATPTAIVVGTGLGANHGILIRNGEALEKTHKTDTVVFDKTGTLTLGKPAVAFIKALQISEKDLIAKVAIAEQASQHPLAAAFIEKAKEMNASIEGLTVNDFRNTSGMGIEADFSDGSTVIIGNAALMQKHEISLGELEKLSEDFGAKGQTPVFVATNAALSGLISVADQLKPNAKIAIDELKKMGIHTVLLTGDNERTAKTIGDELQMDEVIANVLPEGKAKVIEQFRQSGKTVLMVGDGINDSPALAAADVGLAIGNGSDIAIETADVVLMKSDIQDVARAIRLSHLTIRNIKQNLFWAFIYNVIGIPIAAGLLYVFGGPLMNPMLAGLAMSLSSVFVVGNALRLKKAKL
ncbi:MAG: copper-translocating P-type ATPase [Clostridiales bacterium]|nr:copper-translocating P-type ATPase [Clostridiales bacterium]